MRGRRGWRGWRGWGVRRGGEGQHASVVSVASHAIYGSCNIDTLVETAHIHFPHMVLSEVRVHVVVPLLGWPVGNAVTNGEKLGESYHIT